MNEISVNTAFSRQAKVFDEIFSGNAIIEYKRQRVREHLLSMLQPGSKILEINAGTGEDAIYFASKGFYVHATDLSVEMQSVMQRKIAASGFGSMITSETCSFNALAALKNKGPFDAVFSNFAGLNCTDRLDKVLRSFETVIKPGGIATMVILPKFCLWEFMMLFRGWFKTAFRRMLSRKANLEGVKFKCWYYNPSYVGKHLPKGFEVVSVEGLCTLVPPSYLENFPRKFPNMFERLKKLEAKFKSKWPWKVIGDYYIITIRLRDL